MKHHSDDNSETEEERETREYTSFSVYSPDEIDSNTRKNDMLNYKRSESAALTKKNAFQHTVRKLIKLQSLVSKLKSFNSKLVKATLIEIVPLINSPDTAIVLKEAGICPILLDLLKFDPLTHWIIVGLSLQSLLSIVSIPECSIAVIALPSFPSTIEIFLKSEKPLTQKIAAGIVHHCFVQPIQNEWMVLRDKNMLGLLFKALELPYKDVQIKFLSLLEDLTYHCENTLHLCLFAETIEIDFIHFIVDLILMEGNTDMRLLAMKIYLNALTAIQFDRRIERAVILHALTIETSLMKGLQRSRLRKTSALMSRSSKLFQLDRMSSRDVTPEIERNPLPVRRSSIMKFKALETVDFNGENKKEYGTVDMVRPHPSGREGLDRMTADAVLHIAEEMSLTTEILWLIRSSVMFQRLVKHTKRTNLISPTDSISQLCTA